MKIKEFLSELARYGIEVEYSNGRIKLTGGNETAREHYSSFFPANPKFEADLIWYLAQTDEDIMDAIEERQAIRFVENGDDSVEGAIMCNLLDLTA